MLSPRKTLGAFALVLLVASSGVLVADTVEDAAWLADARVGEPRHGDVVAYAGTSEPAEFWTGGGDARQVAFRWDGTAEARDAFGQVRTFDRLVLAATGGVHNVSFVRGSTTPHVMEWARESMSHTSEANGTGTIIREHTSHRVAYPRGEGGSRYALHGQPELLLARAEWQGLAVADLPGTPASAFGATAAGFVGGAFRDAGADIVNGVPVRWMEADLGRSQGTVGVAFADGLPYPMVMRLEVTDFWGGRDPPKDWPDRIVTTFTLTGFVPGDGPRLADAPDPSVPALTRAHVDRLAPTRFGLPAHGNASVPVPLETAWREAAELDRFRNWSREHPSYGVRSVTWTAREGAWRFLFEAFDGDGLTVHVRPATACADASCLTVTANEGSGSYTRYGRDGEELQVRGYAFPRKGVTLAGAIESYAAWAVTSHAASRVQFDAARTWSDGSREPAVVRVTAAHNVSDPWLEESLALAFATGRVLEHSWGENATLAREGTTPLVNGADASPRAPPRARVLPFDVPTRVPYAAASGLALVLLALAVFAERLPAAGAFVYTHFAREGARRADGSDAVRDTPPIVLRDDAVPANASPETRVLELVRAEPGVHASDLAGRLGVSAAVVHEAVWRLVDEGRVEKRPGVGGRVALVPADARVERRP